MTYLVYIHIIHNRFGLVLFGINISIIVPAQIITHTLLNKVDLAHLWDTLVLDQRPICIRPRRIIILKYLDYIEFFLINNNLNIVRISITFILSWYKFILIGYYGNHLLSENWSPYSRNAVLLYLLIAWLSKGNKRYWSFKRKFLHFIYIIIIIIHYLVRISNDDVW